ncbi:hypothetical protein BGX27_006675 [Mortierella sp. AM989]|nr:hypothetical protein BGX27_006675 [Mortierella sp. AM989]
MLRNALFTVLWFTFKSRVNSASPEGKIGGSNFYLDCKVGQTSDSYVVGEDFALRNFKFSVGSVIFGVLGIEKYSRVPTVNDQQIIEDA